MRKKERSDDELIKALQSPNQRIQNDAMTYLIQEKYGRIAINTAKKLAQGTHYTQDDYDDFANICLYAFFVRVSQGHFQGESKMSTYYISLVRKQWFKYQRDNKKLPLYYSTELHLETPSKAQEINAREQKAYAEMLELVKIQIQGMSEKCKSIFSLYIDDFGTKALQNIFKHRSSGTIKNDRSACRKELKRRCMEIPLLATYLNS